MATDGVREVGVSAVDENVSCGGVVNAVPPSNSTITAKEWTRGVAIRVKNPPIPLLRWGTRELMVASTASPAY